MTLTERLQLILDIMNSGRIEQAKREIEKLKEEYLKKGLPIDVAELCLMAHRAVSSLDCLGDIYMADKLAGAMQPFLEIVGNKQSLRAEKVVPALEGVQFGPPSEMDMHRWMVALESKIDAIAARVK